MELRTIFHVTIENWKSSPKHVYKHASLYKHHLAQSKSICNVNKMVPPALFRVVYSGLHKRCNNPAHNAA
jgi:hypothetical protein